MHRIASGPLNEGNALQLTNATIHGNSSTVLGGGVRISSGVTATVTNSTITGNLADPDGMSGTDGGGIANFGTLTLNNTVVAENTSALD